MKKITQIIFGLLLASFVMGCGARVEATVTAAPRPTLTAVLATQPATHPPETLILSTTQNNLLGNHWVQGSVDLATASVLDIPLDGEPRWLVSAPLGEGALFVAVMDTGAVQAFSVSAKSYQPYAISPSQLPAGMPPLLAIVDGQPQLIIPPADASPLTSPLLIGDQLAYIATNGDLVLMGAAGEARLPIHALPDARIVVDEKQRLLILTQPTDRYDHGVLGDTLEAAGITLIETTPTLRVSQTISIEAPDVIEGISAIWADIDEDGARDMIVTLSNNQSGARIAAFREDGTLLAESAALRLGHRWRHQIAVAAFGEKAQPMLVSISTPHIGGIVQFLQFSQGKLDIVNEIQGFSSHSIGSRNLDSALAGDFNHDGFNELLAPDQAHTNLGIIDVDGTVAVLSLGAVLTSNLSATNLDGKLIVGAGMFGKLRIWIP